jgi:hypothetical protein
MLWQVKFHRAAGFVVAAAALPNQQTKTKDREGGGSKTERDERFAFKTTTNIAANRRNETVKFRGRLKRLNFLFDMWGKKSYSGMVRFRGGGAHEYASRC